MALKNEFILHILDENDFIIKCSDCGGASVSDPHRGLTISDGTIRFNSLCGCCSKTSVSVDFEYEQNADDRFPKTIETTSYDCNERDEEGGVKTVYQKEIITDTIRFEDFKWDYLNF